MAIVDGSLQLGYKDSAWFTSNASVVLLVGQIVYLEQTGTYKIGDGVKALSALPFLGGSSITPNLQEVTDEGASTTNAINAPQYSTSGGEVTITTGMVEVLDSTNSSQLLYVNRTTDSIKKLGVDIATVNDIVAVNTNTIGSAINGASSATPNDTDLVMSVESGVAKKNTWTQIKAFLKTYFDTIYLKLTGGFLTGLLGLAKSTNITSATITDLSTATGNLAHIIGNTTIDSFGTLPAGTKIDLVFDGTPIITNSANIICPGNVSLVAGVNDTATVVSEGGGVWRCLSYFRYDESYTNFTPSFTGFSTPPTITPGDWRWKMLTKNTFHLIGWGTATGTSNSTAMTVTAPFTLAWAGGAGYGLQHVPCVVISNGVGVLGTVRSRVGNSNILDVYTAATSGASATGSKNVFIDAVFQMVI